MIWPTPGAALPRVAAIPRTPRPADTLLPSEPAEAVLTIPPASMTPWKTFLPCKTPAAPPKTERSGNRTLSSSTCRHKRPDRIKSRTRSAFEESACDARVVIPGCAVTWGFSIRPLPNIRKVQVLDGRKKNYAAQGSWQFQCHEERQLCRRTQYPGCNSLKND